MPDTRWPPQIPNELQYVVNLKGKKKKNKTNNT